MKRYLAVPALLTVVLVCASRAHAMYADGLNLYQYVQSNPVRMTDPAGTWGGDVHNTKTKEWAVAEQYPEAAAGTIGQADEAVDGGRTGGGRGWAPYGDQSYHFDRNRGRGQDTRLKHFGEHFEKAWKHCDWKNGQKDEPEDAANELGTGLHPQQDWVAHGDYGYFIDGNIFAVHNAYSPQTNLGGDVSHYPDDPTLDAVNGPNGRPSGLALKVLVIDKFGFIPQSREYAIYQKGTQRITLTEQMTRKALQDFRSKVKELGRPNCKCWQYFGITP